MLVDPSGRRVGHGLSEVGRHLAEAQDFDGLAAYAASVGDAGLGEVTVAALLGERVPNLPTTHPGYLAVADREAQALIRSGNITAARQRLTLMLELARGRAEADPGNAQAQRDLSVLYNRLGT